VDTRATALPGQAVQPIFCMQADGAQRGACQYFCDKTLCWACKVCMVLMAIMHSSLPCTGGVACDRSLGDLTAATVGCTSDPEVTFTTLRPHTDQVLVMATDGVWDVLTNEQVRADPDASILLFAKYRWHVCVLANMHSEHESNSPHWKSQQSSRRACVCAGFGY